MVLREQIWNKEERKFEFHKIGKIDLKLFKKVVDVNAIAEKPFDINVWDSSAKAEVKYTVSPGEEFTLESFSAGKVRDLLDTFDLTDDVITDPTTEKRPFDWEDGIKNRLEGKTFSFKVTGIGLETRYRFKELPGFTIAASVSDADEIFIDDVPF
jgi:hypothetical protein